MRAPDHEPRRRACARGTAAGLLLAAGATVPAQDEDAVRTIAPVPAVVQPLAAHSLVVDVTRAGPKLVAVGERGHVLLSDDATHWRQVVAPVDTLLTAVSFADSEHGWAVGHDTVILHSDDGGGHWRLQHFEPARETPLLDVLFIDARRGYAVGAYGTYLVTADGGATWEEPAAEALRGEELHLNAIVALGDGSLLVAGESGMLAVSGDGLDYQRLQAPYTGSLFGALPLGERGALIFGLRGNAYRTDDVRTGVWSRLATGSVASLFGGARLDAARLALVGSGGTLLLVDPATGAVTPRATGLSTAQSALLPLGPRLLLAGKSGLHALEAAP
jgi:photosystem II stability/assembly factor-like uncharacterized protein